MIKNKKLLILIGLSMLFLGSCGKELVAPEPKSYVPEIEEEIDVYPGKATIKEPVPAGENVYISGLLKKNRYENVEGNYMAKIERVMRAEASKDRIQNEKTFSFAPKKGQDWVIVEVGVNNLGREDGPLVFNKDSIGLYTKKGKAIPVYDVGLNSDYSKAVIYEGKPLTVTLTGVVDNKVEDILVGFDHLEEEYSLLEREEITEEEKQKKKLDNTENEGEEGQEKETEIKKTEDGIEINENPEIKYLTTKYAIQLESLDPQDAEKEKERYREYRKEQEIKNIDFEIDTLEEDKSGTKDEEKEKEETE